MRRVFLSLAIVAMVVLGWIAWGYGREFLAVDSCLDSSGSFDYATMTCDHTDSHPYSPYTQRHPTVTSIAVLAGSVAACGLAGFFLSRRQSERV
jgi:predicted small lipoprotein YifL